MSKVLTAWVVFGFAGFLPSYADVPVTIAANVAGQVFTVTGAGCQPNGYTTPQTLQWTPGASCTVSFLSPHSSQVGMQYVFDNWQDGISTNPRAIVAPAQAMSYTANFTTQYFLSVQANPPEGGTVSGGGWWNANSIATVSATANPGYKFVNWTGFFAVSNPLQFGVTGAQTITANFSPVANAPPGNYTVTQILTGGSAVGINAFGQVAGSAGYSQPFLWTPVAANGVVGSVTGLAGLPLGAGAFSTASGINDRGEVVGVTTSQPHNSLGQVFLWSPAGANASTGGVTAISTPNGQVGPAPAINNFGQIGYFDGSWSIWTPNVANGTTGTIATPVRRS